MRLAMTTLLAVLLVLAGLASSGRAGEDLAPEAFLPSVGGKDAYMPTAIFGKDSFLVVWRSGHLAEGDLREGLKFDAKLVGCRLDKAGKLLDAQPFIVCGAKELREWPRLAFSGDVFLAVWQDLRNEKDWDVYAARITPDGKVLDPDGFLVSGGAHNQALPDVTWDGSAFQVVWQDFRSGEFYEIYGARVSKEGKVLDPQGTLLATGKKVIHRAGPVVAALPSGGKSLLFCLGSHANTKTPYAQCLFIEGGKVAGEPTFTADSWQKPPGGTTAPMPAFLAAGPKEYLLTWTTGTGKTLNESNAAIFDAEGKSRKFLALAGKGRDELTRIDKPQAAWDGKAFVAAWMEYDTQPVGVVGRKPDYPLEAVFATRVTSEGEPGAKLRVSGECEHPAVRPTVASDGAGTSLIAYEKHPDKGDVPIKIGFRILTAK